MLNDYSIDPKDGKKPEYLVIFFHGFSGDGCDAVKRVGGVLHPLLPEAKLRFPDAPIDLMPHPEDCAYQGPEEYRPQPGDIKMRSWFDLMDMLTDPDSAKVRDRATAAAREINEYIDKVVAEEDISEDRVILAGFSQGATMAYYAGLLRDRPVGGVFSLSGGALDRIDHISKPPVFLAAGDLERGHYSGMPHALHTHPLLEQAGFKAECVIIPDHGHDASPQAMSLLADFVHRLTPAPEQDNKPPKNNRKPSGPVPGL